MSRCSLREVKVLTETSAVQGLEGPRRARADRCGICLEYSRFGYAKSLWPMPDRCVHIGFPGNGGTTRALIAIKVSH